MNIIMIGCEFTGKTTLSTEIVYWIEENMGDGSHFHDHFTIPSTELSAEAAVNYQAADPQVKEMLQRGYIFLPAGEHGDVITFTPPFTITDKQLGSAVHALHSALA